MSGRPRKRIRDTATGGPPFGVDGTPDVAIIGAGLGGIAAAVELLQRGISTFTIFEKSAAPGGVWWDNTYPGAEVDTPSQIYSFGFKLHPWRRTHATRGELLQYINETVAEYGLEKHLRLSCGVAEARWCEYSHRYSATTTDGDELEFDVVVSAVGFLNVPQYPSWPGLETFGGRCFHSARWEHEIDLAGKRVAVVGSGSTAAQIVPAVAERARQVIQFQREPGWVRPKNDRNFTRDELARYSPRRAAVERIQTFWQYEWPMLGGRAARAGTRQNLKMMERCRRHIERQLPGRPDLQAMVTPAHPYFGKRPVASDTYYPALLRDNVTLIPRAVTSVTPGGVTDSSGAEYPVDVLILATGFRATDYLGSFTLRGRDSRTLKDFWAGEPLAFLGVTVPGFPNFYMLYGPNTNGGAIVSNLHRQAEYAARAIGLMVRRDVTAVEVRRSAFEWYNQWLGRRLAKTVWMSSNNYYKAASGRVVTNFPDSAAVYALLLRLALPSLVCRTRRARHRAGGGGSSRPSGDACQLADHRGQGER